MSYILDALRKSDRERHRGASPTLFSMQIPLAVAPKRTPRWLYPLLAVLLLICGIAIGWLRPWAAGTSDDVAQPVGPSHGQQAQDTYPTLVPPDQNRPLAASAPGPVSEMARAEQPRPVKEQTKPRQHFTREAAPAEPSKALENTNSIPQPVMAIGGTRVEPMEPANSPTGPGSRVLTLAELPLPLQQELPKLAISVHAYSSEPARRMVGINGRVLREGAEVSPGLRLEQIRPEGLVLSYKGYRFQRGVF